MNGVRDHFKEEGGKATHPFLYAGIGAALTALVAVPLAVLSGHVLLMTGVAGLVNGCTLWERVRRREGQLFVKQNCIGYAAGILAAGALVIMGNKALATQNTDSPASQKTAITVQAPDRSAALQVGNSTYVIG